MLVFSRRKGQRIVIANEIEIIVTHTSRASVKIAVRAPAQHSVLRGEVFDAIVEANRAAADSPLETGAVSAPLSASAADCDEEQSASNEGESAEPESLKLSASPSL